MPNKIYTFSISVSGDYITITSAAGVVLATGTTPLVWNSGNNTGTFRYHLHGNASCTAQQVTRERRVKCQANLDIEDIVLEHLRLYPNPVTNRLQVSNSETIDAISISNALGQVLQQRNVDANTTELNFEGYASGVYFVIVMAQGKSTVVKIVKQ